MLIKFSPLDAQEVVKMTTKENQFYFWPSLSVLITAIIRFANIWAIEAERMHICVSNRTIIGSDDGVSPCRCQAIIWTKIEILLIEPTGTNFS